MLTLSILRDCLTESQVNESNHNGWHTYNSYSEFYDFYEQKSSRNMYILIYYIIKQNNSYL